MYKRSRDGHPHLGASLGARHRPGSPDIGAARSAEPGRDSVPRYSDGGSAAVVGARPVRGVGAPDRRKFQRRHRERPQRGGVDLRRQPAQTAGLEKRSTGSTAAGGPSGQSDGMARRTRRSLSTASGICPVACPAYDPFEEAAFPEAAGLPSSSELVTRLWVGAASCGAGMRGPEIGAAEIGDLTEVGGCGCP